MTAEQSQEWVVYMILTESGTLYTGITNNLERRISEHQNRKKGARFFHFSNPKAIVLRESYSNRSEASKREAAIKKMSRKEKLSLTERK